jgi:ATP-binding cassette subfamily B protein
LYRKMGGMESKWSPMNIPLKQYWTLLSHYLRPQWPKASLLAVLLLSHIGLQLLNPQILRYFIDTATSGGPLATLINAALLFIGVAIVNQGLSILNTYLSETVAWTATNALRFDLARHCLNLDLSFHKTHPPGELIERIDGDVSALANFFSQFLIHVLGNLVLLLGVLVLLFREDWRVGAGLSLFALVGLGTLIRIRAIAIPYWTEVRQVGATFFGFLGELLAGTEDIRANGAETYIMRRFYETMRRWFPIRLKANLAGYAMWMTNIAVFALGNVVAFSLSAYLWQTEAITIGTIYLIFHYTELLRRPIDQIRTQIADLQKAEASIARIEALLGTQSKLHRVSGAPLPAGALSVAWQNVSFSYDGQETVLRNVSFQLQPGRVLGLLGRTGSGKTTLARLLLRLYDPTSGEIRLGGVAPCTLRLSDIRQRVGMVTQEVQLFQATIRDNLTFFNPTISDEQLLAVLNDLGLSPWLQALPNGLDTELAPDGSSLSAGQAQLLALARVFLADPGLVILDEASSRLDPATERLIERAVNKLLENRTGIVIAHRLATVHRADEILILEDGQILERGERVALANNPNSHFYHLLQTGLEEVLA